MHVLAPFVSATQKNVAGAPPLTWYFTGGLGTVTVGRKDTDILILTDNSISKTHATLTITEAEEVGQPPLITVKRKCRYCRRCDGCASMRRHMRRHGTPSPPVTPPLDLNNFCLDVRPYV